MKSIFTSLFTCLPFILLLGQGLHVEQGTANTSTQTGGYLWVGDKSNQHLSFDENEIQARFDFGDNILNLNTNGGGINMLKQGDFFADLNVDGDGLFYDNSLDRIGLGTLTPLATLHNTGRTLTRGMDLIGQSYFAPETDDGLIRCIDGPGADIFLIANDAVVVELDNDNNEAGDFTILNGTNETVFNVAENGHTVVGTGGNGNTLLTLNAERSWSFRQFNSGANTGIQLTPSDSGNQNKPFVINSTANVGIGSDLSPDYKLEVGGSAGKPGGGSWSNSSDRRLKTGIKEFDQGLDLIQKVEPIYFHYNGKDNLPTEQEYVGVIAQELQKVAPFMVSEYSGDDGETYLAVDPSAFDFVLINAVKELATEVKALKAQIKVDQPISKVISSH